MASDRNPANSEQFDAAAVREASGALGSGAGAGAGGVGASAGMCHQSFGWAGRQTLFAAETVQFFLKVVTFSSRSRKGSFGRVVASRAGHPPTPSRAGARVP